MKKLLHRIILSFNHWHAEREVPQKVGVTLGWESGDRFGTGVADQYLPLPALKPHADSDENEVYWGYYSDNNSVNAATAALSANCKK